MKEYKVLLLYPNLMMKHILSPAIGVLTSALKNNGFKVSLFDTTYYKTETENPDEKRKQFMQVRPYRVVDYGIRVKTSDVVEDFRKKVAEFKPDIVGVTTVEDTLELSLKLINSLGENRPKTIFGGIYMSYLKEKAFDHKEIDMACIGEGEEALPELCTKIRDGQDYTSVSNIYLRNGEKIIKNRVRPLVDLDYLPMPDYSLFETKRLYSPMQGKMYKMLPIDFDRGCPYSCNFCASPAYREWYRKENSQMYFRKKSLSRIIEEMIYLKEKYKPEYLYFNSDTFFTLSDDIFNKLLFSIQENINLPFWCQTRVETITEDRIKMLKDSGCDRLTVGLEHGNEEFRKKVIGKSFTNKQFIKATEIINKLGLPLSLNNMIGFPYETRDLIFDTIELNRQVKADSISAFIFYPYVGTRLYELCREDDLIDQNTKDSSLLQNSVIKNSNISQEQLNRLLKTFCLYARFPKERWADIGKVEKEENGSEAIFEGLSREYQEKYF